jgi:membrane-associated phospholipid phosphatase
VLSAPKAQPEGNPNRVGGSRNARLGPFLITLTGEPVTDFLVGLDVSIYRALNDFVGWNPTFDRILAHHEILKGPLFALIVGVLWYWPDKDTPWRRETLLTMMVVVVGLSIVVNRTLSTLLPFRVRPMYSIGANQPNFSAWHVNFEQWSSFPSDTATYLFAIAAGLWLILRWLGLFFGVFAALVALARVFLGIHYPSDIFVGALIGIATSIALNRETVRKRVVAPILTLEVRYPPYFYGLFLSRTLRVVGRVRDHSAHWPGHRAFLHWVPQLMDDTLIEHLRANRQNVIQFSEASKLTGREMCPALNVQHYRWEVAQRQRPKYMA